MRAWCAAGIVAAVLAASGAAVAEDIPVDLELVLAVDASSSIDTREFGQQLKGYRDAFTNPGVIAAIQNGDIGATAVILVLWTVSTASSSSQV